MRTFAPALLAGLLAFSLPALASPFLACNRAANPAATSASGEAAQPEALIPSAVNPAEAELTGGAIVEATGASTAALGLYWLERDSSDPTIAQLTMGRAANAQGDLYALSIRPYMNASSLVLTNSAAGPDATTDYTFRFTHPFAMPADLNRPQTATKRVDLFINDVNIVLAISGADTFFAGAIKTNIQAMPNASGYRMTGPMFNAAAIGVGGGTNVFPYRLFTRASTTSPAGNFDATNGWLGSELLNPSGYDVIAQGQNAITTLRLKNTIASPLPLVLVAKYMDPRKGTTSAQKRANRLPDPADPTACRYFLPEAAGDLQDIVLNVAGTLKADSSSDLVNISGTILDWDNASTKAATFPNQSNLNQISELSDPQQVELSFPQLKAAGTYTGSIGASSGGISQFVAVSAVINNVDQTYTVANVGGDTVYGLMRIRDQQDGTSPAAIVIDEALVPQSPPSSFELSTRFQRLGVLVTPATASLPPDLTAVTPLTGNQGASTLFSATNGGGPVVSWSWNFGGGATPNTSTSATPTVTLGAPGVYSGTVTATNVAGSDPFPFTLTVNTLPPDLTAVSPLTGPAGASRSFSATNVGGTATSWSWNFGGGASPNTSTSASPTVTLGAAGTYSCTVTATNVAGSDPFPFTLNVTTCAVPVISAVNFSTLQGLRSSTASATISNSPTSWSWNFGGGATPNTSTSASPVVTLSTPGTYSGTLTATNSCGASTPFPFSLVVGYKSVGMRIRVITSGASQPTRLQGMPATTPWTLTNVNNWITTYVNPIFANTAIRFDTAQTDFALQDLPTYFNLDTATEENNFFNNYVLAQSSARINVFVINSAPFFPGLGGVMADQCNYNNSTRGCYVISFNSSFDTIVMPHEIGHIMNLPHIRTDTTPLTSQNNNLMSYGTLNTSLSSNITREDPVSCNTWPTNPMNQFSVVNNWNHTYM